MALKKRGDIWHVRKMVGSVLIAKSTKTSNKRIAEQLEAKWVAEVHAETVVAGRKPVTVKKAIEVFLESRRGTAGYASAEVKLRIFKPLLTKQLHEVTEADVYAIAKPLIKDKSFEVNTINVSLVYWNALQNYCNKTGFTCGEKVKRLKGGNKTIRFLSPAEIQSLLAELNPTNTIYREKRKAQDNFDYTVMLLNTGARDREVATIKMEQIDMVNNTLTIIRSKGGTDTTFKLSKAMSEVIARRMVEAEKDHPPEQLLHGRIGNGYLFPERAKTERYNNEYLVKACNRAKIKDVHVHTLRHTFATQMLKAGLSIPEVQHLLGHRNINSTMVYAHLVPNLTANRACNVLDAVLDAA